MLTPKKKKFADEFFKCGNQSEAYRRAYNCKKMKPETITENASRLMRDKDVSARVQKLQDKLDKKNIADAQEIQETLTKMLRGEIKEECVAVESIGDYQSQAIIIKKTITPKDRIKAGELLAKIKGEFNITIKLPEPPIINDDI